MTEITEIGEPPKKELFRIQIPFALRFSLIWVIFFSIVGLAIQYILTKSFSLKFFFITDFIQWFKDFSVLGNFDVLQKDFLLIMPLLERGYYFFITGGLISLIWSLISWIINFELVFKKPEKRQVITEPPLQEQISKEDYFIQESSQKNSFINRVQQPVQNILSSSFFKEEKINENLEKINEWLEEGLRMLSNGNLEESELIYNSLKQEYDPENDAYGILQRRIVSFYEEIMAERNDRIKSKNKK